MKRLGTIIRGNFNEAVELLKKHGKPLVFVDEDLLDLSDFNDPKAKDGVDESDIIKEHDDVNGTWVFTIYDDVSEIRLLAVRLGHDADDDVIIDCVGINEEEGLITFTNDDCVSNSENDMYIAIGEALGANIE